MPDNPYAQYAPKNPYAVYGAPRLPAPQTAPQQQSDVLGVTHLKQQIDAQPLQNANTQINIEQGHQGIASSQQQMRIGQLNATTDLQKSFRSDPAVQSYREASSNIAGALNARPGGEGDLTVIYGWAKTMDPTGSVREGDTGLAKSVSPVWQRAENMANQVRHGNFLPPEIRVGLTEEMRRKGKLLNQQYGEVRRGYESAAHDAGIDPSVLGKAEAELFRPQEEQYIRDHGGTPKINGVPVDTPAPADQAPTKTIGGFDGELPRNDPIPPHAEDFRNGMYGAMRHGQIKSVADMRSWVDGFNKQNGSNFHPELSAKETMLAIRAARQGKAFNIELPKYAPDISDIRDGKGLGEKADAGIRGAADTLTYGLADKAAALGDTVVRGGTFDENLARQYAISDYDTQNHFPSRLTGQVAGGLALPMGEMSSMGQIVSKGAAMGAGYGAGSSRSLSDVPQNALLGGAGGAAIGWALGGAPRALQALRGASGKIDAASEGVAMREKQIAAAQAGDELGIQMPRFVAGGPTAQRLGALADQSQIGAPIIRRATNAMLDQSEAARNQIAADIGKAMNHEGMGDTAIAGAGKARMALKGGYRRVYDVAERLSGDTRVPLPTAKQEVLAQVAELGDTPGGVQPAISSTLKDIASKMDGDWTPASVRRMRSLLRQRFVDSGVDHGDASRRAQRITDAAETDMITGLRAANKGDAAGAWQQASKMRASYQRTVDDTLAPILGINKDKTGPEVARALVSAVKNNPGRFRQFMAHMPPEEANDVRASLIGQMGNPGSGGQDVAGEAFSLAKFLTHWNDLKDVRNHVFEPDTVKALNKLAMVAERAKQAGHVENHSQTGSIGIAMLTAGPTASAPGLLLSGHPSAALGAVGTSVVLGVAQAIGAKALASPRYAKWLVGLANAEASGNPNAVRSQMGRLAKLATTNPELREPIEKLLRSANDNMGTVGRAAAGPDPERNQQ